jgi:uncharacterized protein
MMKDKFFENLKKEVKKVVGEEGSHDFSHTERVYKYSIAISKNLDVDLDIVKAAALLHDVARPQEEKGKIKDHAAQGATEARIILERKGFPKEKIEIVCKCILLHNKKEDLPEIKEIRVLKEADGLESIGAIGIAREFSFNGEKGHWSSYENILKPIIKNSNPNYFQLPIARQIGEEKSKISKLFINEFIKEHNIKI